MTPAPAVVAEDCGDRIVLTAGQVELVHYVYRPTDVLLESPRPYLSPIRTLGGSLVSLFRPHDHVWHKGIAWSLPVVGDENFWGGPTFVTGEGYVQLPNNGEQRHEGVELAEADGAAALTETLTWVTQAGEHVFDELRTITARVLDPTTWELGFETRMTSTADRVQSIGSPTTRGRDNAGYGGLFWRGPRSFTGGAILAPDREGGDELRGTRAPWMGFRGVHDGDGAVSTVVMADHPENAAHPPQWFARTEDFACLCPAPFFSEERAVEPGATLHERYTVLVHDGGWGSADAGAAVARALSPAGSPVARADAAAP
ncbi:PmoA family protein [uncultured Demequina sp.]|uniref:DUF6807 domain-containing protein n=1 Tax=uncultured Demequina sp. TaxID=693499 RepID=UPI0025E36FEF|nr:PmoA family protein [uncultured Demequina sp.]